jgi:hypothetical protein
VHAEALAAVRAALSPDAMANLWSQGRSRPLEEILGLALI